MKRKLVTSNGPEFTNEKHVGAGLCSSKVSKRLQKDFTSRLLVTSGHTQNSGHDAGKEYRNAPTPIASMSKWSSVAMLHAVEKTILVAQPVQLVALTSPVACYQAVINQWRP